MDSPFASGLRTREEIGAALEWLRQRHSRVNNLDAPLSLREIAERTGAGTFSTIRNYLTGRTLPSREALQRLVTLFEADEEHRTALLQAREDLLTTVRAEKAPPPPEPPPSRPSRRLVLTVAATAVLASAATLAVVLLTRPDSPEPTSPVPVIVQNMVAVGPEGLVEDGTPAYLSARTVPRCAANGCKLTGTEMWSGAALTVECHAEGTVMHNYNVAEGAANPHSARSTIWYRARATDGRAGYLSEVYLQPRFRGGLGLPRCS